MAFSLDDMLERMGVGGKKQGRECYREELASLKKATREEIAKIFPSVTLSESKEVIYAPFRLCHSLPKVNLRGRCFTPKTLSNSFASVRDGLVNVDHQMNYRNKAASGSGDTICGHMVCGRFDPFNQYTDELASVTKIPTEPIPLAALAAFYLRSQYVPAFLEEHLSGTRKWLTSMECAHSWDDAAFFYRGEVIPIKDAQQGMRECVEKLSVRPFKSHALALALGGADGKVDFHAAALTPNPADDGADIMAFVTKDEYMEAANSGENTTDGKKNIFFFPLETKVFENPAEVLPDEEMSMDELANISVLGQTDACDDGHAHDVLSDLTVMPHGGHDHSMGSMALVKGTNPRLTGRTSTHHDYSREPSTGESKTKVHLHTFNIPLRGKANSPAKTKATETGNANPTALPQELFPVPAIYPTELPMDELFKRMLAVLSAGKFEGQSQTEVASLTSEIHKAGQKNYVQELVKTEIANQVSAGELVTKDDHTKKLEAALKEATDKADKEKKDSEARASRREKALGLGLDMEAKFNETSDLTVAQYIDSFGLDDAGQKTFDVALATLESLKKLTAPAPVATETQAANAGKAPAKPGKTDEQANKPKPKMLLAGRSGDSEEEGAAGKPAKPVVGRGIFKTAI